MTSSTKPEVHNILLCCQRRIEPWPQLICKENFAKFGGVVFERCEQTDRHTDTLIAILCTLTRGKVIKIYNKCTEVLHVQYIYAVAWTVQWHKPRLHIVQDSVYQIKVTSLRGRTCTLVVTVGSILPRSWKKLLYTLSYALHVNNNSGWVTST